MANPFTAVPRGSRTWVRNLWTHRALVRGFVVRDLKARYVGSAMGFFWSVVFPIVNLFVYMIVFRLFLQARFEDGAGVRDVALWMLAGILVWAAFAETISRSTNCLVENSNLIQKVVFPSEVLPVYLAFSSVVNMLIGLPIVLIGRFFVFEENALPGVELLALPILILLQVIFTVGLGNFLCTFNLFLRDTFHVIGVGITVWMFMTPIFYPPLSVRKPIPLSDDVDGPTMSLGFLLDINPMHWLIQSWRAVLLDNRWPDWLLLGRFALVALVVFALGSAFFSYHKRRFPDLL